MTPVRDSRERMDMCLNCKKPASKCYGNCSLKTEVTEEDLLFSYKGKVNRSRIIELVKQGIVDTEIAKIVGCSNKTVGEVRNKLGLPPVRKHSKKG